MTLVRFNHNLIIATMLLSTFMASIEGTVITTAMPTIIIRLGHISLFSWVYGIYLLSQAVTIPIYGRLSDAYGRKRLFLLSTLIFLLGSFLCGYAWSMNSLILFRGIQGLGGGGLVPIALTVIADISKPLDRPRMLGYVSAVWGFSAIVGPLVGTLLVSGPGWPFVFWINVPLGLVTMFFVALLLRDPPIQKRPLIDWWGVSFLLVALCALMIFAIDLFDLSLEMIAVLLSVTALSSAAFIGRECSSGKPLFAGYLLLRPVIFLSAASAFLCGALLLGSTGFLPIWAEGVAHTGPSSAGFSVGFLTFSWTIANLCIGKVMSTLRFRPIAIASSCVLVLGCSGLLTLNENHSLILLDALSCFIGIGLGVNTLVFTVAVQSAVVTSERTRATALFFFFRMLGQTLGTALFGGVLNSALGLVGIAGRVQVPAFEYDANILATGLQHVFVLFALLASAALVASGFVPPRDGIAVDLLPNASD